MPINRRKLLTLFGLGAVLGPSAVAPIAVASGAKTLPPKWGTIDLVVARGADGIPTMLGKGDFIVSSERLKRARFIFRLVRNGLTPEEASATYESLERSGRLDEVAEILRRELEEAGWKKVAEWEAAAAVIPGEITADDISWAERAIAAIEDGEGRP
jgi:hypothetical protein